MSDDILNYRFVVPKTIEAQRFLYKYHRDKWQSSDGGPDCTIVEGYLFDIQDLENINIPSDYTVYEISDRFLDTQDFITAYWDGDVEDDDFIEV